MAQGFERELGLANGEKVDSIRNMRPVWFKAVPWIGVIYFMAGMSSRAALRWSLHPVPRDGTNRVATLIGVAFGNGKFLAIADSGEIYSAPAEDPQTWTRGGGIPDVDLRTMIFADGRFAAVGLDT